MVTFLTYFTKLHNLKMPINSYYLPRTVFVFLFGLAIYLKVPDQFKNPQFWAEDGTIFFMEAQAHGIKSIILPYAGYLHLTPRLVALFADFFPIIFAPAIYFYMSILILIIVAWNFLSTYDGQGFKFLLVGSMVVVPINGEVFNSLTNLQWLLAPFLILLCIFDSKVNNKEKTITYISLALISLSGPFCIFFTPFILLFYKLNKRLQKNWIPISILVLCSLIQGIFLINSNRLEHNYPPFWLFKDLVLNNFLGKILISPWPASQSKIILPIVSCIFIFWLCVCLIQLTREKIVIGTSLLSLVFILVYLGLQACNSNPGISPFTSGQRYFFLPTLFLIWLIGYLIMQQIKLRLFGIFWLLFISLSAVNSF